MITLLPEACNGCGICVKVCPHRGNLVNCSDPAEVQSYEEGSFSSSACVETAVIGDAGHDLNLQTNAGSAYAKMLSWADRNVGAGPGPAPQPCP